MLPYPCAPQQSRYTGFVHKQRGYYSNKYATLCGHPRPSYQTKRTGTMKKKAEYLRRTAAQCVWPPIYFSLFWRIERPQVFPFFCSIPCPPKNIGSHDLTPRVFTRHEARALKYHVIYLNRAWSTGWAHVRCQRSAKTRVRSVLY